MTDGRLEDLPPHSRRGFFAAGLSRILRPLADYLEERLPEGLATVRHHLRPPGALPEAEFLDTCYRCGSCVDACPASAIEQLRSQDTQLDGTPRIDPARQPCVVCNEIACTAACPSGALQRVDKSRIRIGLARVEPNLCLRIKGDPCEACLDACPFHRVAIQLDDAGRVKVIDPRGIGSGCVGCGMCQSRCPTTPQKAIRVYPY